MFTIRRIPFIGVFIIFLCSPLLIGSHPTGGYDGTQAAHVAAGRIASETAKKLLVRQLYNLHGWHTQSDSHGWYASGLSASPEDGVTGHADERETQAVTAGLARSDEQRLFVLDLTISADATGETSRWYFEHVHFKFDLEWCHVVAAIGFWACLLAGCAGLCALTVGVLG